MMPLRHKWHFPGACKGGRHFSWKRKFMHRVLKGEDGSCRDPRVSDELCRQGCLRSGLGGLDLTGGES